MLLCTPAGFEGYFARLAAQAAGEDPPPWALAPTPPVTTVGGQIGERDDIAAATPIAPAAGRVNVLVHGEQSDGRIAVMDNRVGPGLAGPRLHHHAFDELFWVLDGELDLPARRRALRHAARASSPSPLAGWRTRSPTTPTPPRAR